MEENITQEQFSELKNQLDTVTNELNELKEKEVVVKTPNERALDMIFEKGVPIFMGYMQMQQEANAQNFKEEIELEKEEIKVINKLDTKEKIFKGSMLVVTLAVLLLAMSVIPGGDKIVPVLTLIIGLLFKTNSLSDFFSHAKHKIKNDKSED